MPQDQGPIHEPSFFESQITTAHSLDELAKKTERLPVGQKLAINNQGLELEFLLRKWTGKQNAWYELKDKKVLDLASGSTLSRDLKWHPYFARLCSFNGASVTAIDLLSQVGSDAKLLRGITADIIPAVVDGKLAEIVENEKYDIVHSSSFLGFNPSPELLERLDELGIAEEDFHQAFFEQAGGLLSEGGIMCLDERDPQKHEFKYYTKKEGKIIRL